MTIKMQIKFGERWVKVAELVKSLVLNFLEKQWKLVLRGGGGGEEQGFERKFTQWKPEKIKLRYKREKERKRKQKKKKSKQNKK